jgi:putative membrane protein
MKTTIIAKTLFISLLLSTACDTNKKNDNVDVAKDVNTAKMNNTEDEENAKFVVNTMAANYAEIELAPLAIKRTKDSGIKDLASKLNAEHKKLLAEMKDYANKKNISMPTGVTNEAKTKLNNLAEKEGQEFDKSWCELSLNNHDKTIISFENHLEKTNDITLKNWIVNTLTDLRSHDELLRNHHESMN